ncbi:MAG: hypothetical protein U5S82_12735 [Gammaproteobacteria bacterium]|nr:hypothetical protein [Gammaproteobacteria bacterium]
MAFPPDAFLIGAEKCGTTTFTELLAQHPGLVVSDPRDGYRRVAFGGRADAWARPRRPAPTLLTASLGGVLRRAVDHHLTPRWGR